MQKGTDMAKKPLANKLKYIEKNQDNLKKQSERGYYAEGNLRHSMITLKRRKEEKKNQDHRRKTNYFEDHHCCIHI